MKQRKASLFSQEINRLLNPEMEHLQFQTKKLDDENTLYFRVINDVAQGLSFQRCGSGGMCSCDFSFGTIPLCAGIYSLFSFQLHSVSAAEFHQNYMHRSVVSDFFDSRSEEDIQRYIVNHISLIKKHAFPYFEETDTVAGYAEKMWPSAVHGGHKPYDRALFSALLQCEKYKQAVESLLQVKRCYRKEQELYLLEYGHDAAVAEEEQQRKEELFAEIDDKIARTMARDMDWIRAYLQTNKEGALAMLGLG